MSDDKPLVLYRFYDADDNLLYIGITNSPHVRYGQHRSDKRWFKDVVRSTMEHFPTRIELEAAEIRAIQTEKPRYNIAHSVIPGRNQMARPARAVSTRSADANHFKRPDAIACDDEITEEEREAHLDEIEERAARRAVFVPRTPCPSCDLICLTREHDGLFKCLHCLDMFTPEDMSRPSDLEVLKQHMQKKGDAA